MLDILLQFKANESEVGAFWSKVLHRRRGAGEAGTAHGSKVRKKNDDDTCHVYSALPDRLISKAGRCLMLMLSASPVQPEYCPR